MGLHKVSFIIPTRGRPERLALTVASIRETVAYPEIIAVVDTDDPVSIAKCLELEITPVISEPLGYAVPKWNIGLLHTTNEWISSSSDDLIYRPSWLEEALYENVGGFVGMNDGHMQGRDFAPVYLLTKRFIKLCLGGCLAIPCYRSWGVDIEVSRRAQRAGVYVVAMDSHVEHFHPAWGTAVNDETYQQGNRWHQEDMLMFADRERRGFPDDFEACL